MPRGCVPKPLSSQRESLGRTVSNNIVVFCVARKCNLPCSSSSLPWRDSHTFASTAGEIIIYTLATTLSSPQNSGNPRLARAGSGRAPQHGQDPHGKEDQSQVDEVLSQLEQLVNLLERYFHPSNNGRSVGISPAGILVILVFTGVPAAIRSF